MKAVTVFEAQDGTRFTDVLECERYEEDLKKTLENTVYVVTYEDHLNEEFNIVGVYRNIHEAETEAYSTRCHNDDGTPCGFVTPIVLT